VQASDAGTYRVLVSNLAGSIASQVAILTVVIPPSISAQPENVIAVAGYSAELSVTASGSAPLYYQWRRNGSDVIGANGAQLAFSVVEPSHAGSYAVVITNAAGSVTSTVATLTVVVPPVITADPLPQMVLVNSPVTFSVSASGTAPLSYEWRKNGSVISGANGSSYTIASAQPSDEGNYSVRVSNAGGFATSAAASLVVSVAPVLGAPHPLSDGSFVFTLTGATNRDYEIEFSSNLNTWSNLFTVSLTNSSSAVQDTSATNAPVRFYRARMVP
jgi:hypothetical protein